MKNLRIYGNKPYTVALLHGGPGYPGAMAPVARELSADYGVLEPLQSVNTIIGQVAELAAVLLGHADIPVVLVGWSWGSTLALLTASRHPDLVRKLILVCGAPLETKYRVNTFSDALVRLNEEERKEIFHLDEIVNGDVAGDRAAAMARIFALLTRANTYSLLPYRDEVLEYQVDINVSIAREAEELYAGREFPQLLKKIDCPVVAIHGDYDTHPLEGVKGPLSRALKDFRFILLEKCGHSPWYEKYARDKFFDILRKEIEYAFIENK